MADGGRCGHAPAVLSREAVARGSIQPSAAIDSGLELGSFCPVSDEGLPGGGRRSRGARRGEGPYPWDAAPAAVWGRAACPGDDSFDAQGFEGAADGGHEAV